MVAQSSSSSSLSSSLLLSSAEGLAVVREAGVGVEVVFF